MLEHFGTAPSPTISAVDENLILAEIEAFLDENLAKHVQNDGTMTLRESGRRGMRSFPLAVGACVIMIIALVPTGLKKVGGGGKAASHQAMSDGARGSLND